MVERTEQCIRIVATFAVFLNCVVHSVSLSGTPARREENVKGETSRVHLSIQRRYVREPYMHIILGTAIEFEKTTRPSHEGKAVLSNEIFSEKKTGSVRKVVRGGSNKEI